MQLLRQFAARLPHSWQNELKRIHYRHQIWHDRFFNPEPELALLPDLISHGDWVIDIGANVGHYTKRFSELVGPEGRVFAFEPVPATFALLAANIQLFRHQNVTLINAAASDRMGHAGMVVPLSPAGMANYYEAHLSDDADPPIHVVMLSIDSLAISRRIALVKVDTEGHEYFVLKGMERLLQRDHPFLIIETSSREVEERMVSLGYASQRLSSSPNLLFR